MTSFQMGEMRNTAWSSIKNTTPNYLIYIWERPSQSAVSLSRTALWQRLSPIARATASHNERVALMMLVRCLTRHALRSAQALLIRCSTEQPQYRTFTLFTITSHTHYDPESSDLHYNMHEIVSSIPLPSSRLYPPTYPTYSKCSRV